VKITEQTTMAQLQAYLTELGDPELAVTRARRSCMTGGRPEPHVYHAAAYFRAGQVFHGGGATVAEAIEEAFAGLRASLGRGHT